MISSINRQEKLTLELLKVNVISKDLFYNSSSSSSSSSSSYSSSSHYYYYFIEYFRGD